jgi:hypothetical protein
MFTGFSAARKQGKLEREVAVFQFEDALETIRRRRYTQVQVKGATKALTEATGVRHTQGSTAQGYLDEMSSEMKKELTYMQDYAITAKRFALRGARMKTSAAMLDAFFSGVETMFSV